MALYVIRHEISEANDRTNYGALAFGSPDAPLLPKGQKRATILGRRLVSEFGIEVSTEPVAVSAMRRSQETASLAGFETMRMYQSLNEEKGGLNDAELRACLAERNPPEATRNAARLLIKNPPSEIVWVTHALLIATLCQELGVYRNDRFLPRYGEVRELHL